MEALTRAVADPDSLAPGRDELERLSFDVFALDTLVATLYRHGYLPTDATVLAALQVRTEKEARLTHLDRAAR